MINFFNACVNCFLALKHYFSRTKTLFFSHHLERKKERKKIKKRGELSLPFFMCFFTDNGHNLFLDPVQKFRLIHLHQEGFQIPDQCLDTNY